MSSYFLAAEKCGWSHERAVAIRAQTRGTTTAPPAVTKEELPWEAERDQHRAELKEHHDSVLQVEQEKEQGFTNLLFIADLKRKAHEAKLEAEALEKASNEARERLQRSQRHHAIRQAKRHLVAKYGPSFLATPDSEDSSATEDEDRVNESMASNALATVSHVTDDPSGLLFGPSLIEEDAAKEFKDRHHRIPPKSTFTRSALASKLEARIAAASKTMDAGNLTM